MHQRDMCVYSFWYLRITFFHFHTHLCYMFTIETLEKPEKQEEKRLWVIPPLTNNYSEYLNDLRSCLPYVLKACLAAFIQRLFLELSTCCAIYPHTGLRGLHYYNPPVMGLRGGKVLRVTQMSRREL